MNSLDVMETICVDWGIRCFGIDHMRDPRIRSLRSAEEAIELAQACDVDKETVLRLVDVVYSRPKGDPEQEIGGIMVTAAAMAYALGTTMHTLFLRELRRCLIKPPEHFHQRNVEKLELGLK